MLNTLKDLIDTLGAVKKAEKTPTSRKLSEEAGEPILATDSIRIYACGYAVYENESGRTVMWVPACNSFTYYFDKETELEQTYIPQKSVLPDGMLETLPWEMVLTMIGDHRIEANSMNRAGSRGGRAAFECEDDGDKNGEREMATEEPYWKEFEWREDHIGEDPESIYIRKESREEALARMTEKQREVFILYYFEGYTQEEIATMLKIAQPMVCKHLGKSLEAIKQTGV